MIYVCFVELATQRCAACIFCIISNQDEMTETEEEERKMRRWEKNFLCHVAIVYVTRGGRDDFHFFLLLRDGSDLNVTHKRNSQCCHGVHFQLEVGSHSEKKSKLNSGKTFPISRQQHGTRSMERQKEKSEKSEQDQLFCYSIQKPAVMMLILKFSNDDFSSQDRARSLIAERFYEFLTFWFSRNGPISLNETKTELMFNVRRRKYVS